MNARCLLLGLVLFAAGFGSAAPESRAAGVTVAAAANLTFALDPLREAFHREHPEIEVTLSLGATGNLVAQIRRGAPFDVLLAADLDYPRALIASGHAAADTLQAFARGRLVWWSLQAPPPGADLATALDDPTLRRIAIAQPAHAPYGVAAREVLQHLGRWDDLQPKVVMGENISQTAQFVETGNVDGGFVALSLVLAPRLKDRGGWIAIPPEFYTPLDQGAVITRRGADNPAAHLFLTWLQGPAAQAVLQQFGYAPPTAAPAAP